MSQSLSPLFRLPRTLLLVPLALVGCHDFVGDLGRIGFSSNLELGTGAWTPEHGVAGGTEARFAPTELMHPEDSADGEGSADGVQLSGSTTGRSLTSWSEESAGTEVLVVTSERGDGWVHYEGHVADRFQVDFVPVRRARLLDAVEWLVSKAEEEGAEIDLSFEGQLDGLEPPVSMGLRELELVKGSAWPFLVQLEDRRGRVLGYDPEELELTATGGASAWTEEGLVFVAADAEKGRVVVAYRGEEIAEIEIVGRDEG